MVRLDASGNRIADFPALSNTRAIAIDLDPSVWVLNHQQVARYSSTGTQLGLVTVHTQLTAAPQLLAVDGVRHYAWVAGGKQVLRLDAAALNATPLMVTLPDAIGGMDVDQETGELWVSQDSELRVFSAQGALIRTISRTSLGVSPIRTVAFDGTGSKAWVGHGSGVASVNRDGTLGTNVALGQVVAGVVGTGFIPTPVVSLTAPTNGATYSAPANVTLTATASVVAGSIAKVEFYQGATLVGSVLSPPYTVNLTNLAAGSYTFTAVATDSHGITGTSSAVSITVNGVTNVPPTVSITAPANGAVFAAPASFTITANAADSDGTVSKVEFFQGATLIGTVTAAPYSVNVSGLAAGTYSYTAKATDNLNATTTSAAIQVISDALPTVSITAPANNAVYTAPATVNLTATASDSDGTISKVEFFQGASLVATVTSAPYTASASGLSAGSYAFTAKATDNLGLATTSTVVNVSVNAPPTVSITAPASGAVFAAPASFAISANAADSDGSISKVEFFQGATLIGTATSPPYTASVSGLAAGTYSFTAKATDNLGATTTSSAVGVVVSAAPTVSITAPANNAVYPAPGTVNLTAVASDSDGTIAKVEFFQGAVLVGTATSAPYTASATNLAAGSYTFTAKATDNVGVATTSAALTVIVDALPTVSLTAPASGATFTAPASIALSATAADSDGTITNVEFYQGATLIGSVNAPPYNLSWNSVAQGTYTLTAKATDDRGLSTISAPVTITVKAPAQLHYIHPDNLGTPRMITRALDNQMVWRWDNSEAFGNNAPNENPSGLGAFAFNLRFPGQYFDSETGTHYNYFRNYDPAIGRYIESDPIGLHAGLSTYGYAFARPVIWTDMYGLDVTVCFYADAAAGFGHVGYSVPGESNTQGFYPEPGKNPFNAPGKVQPDDQKEKQCKVLPADPDQDDCMAKCRKDREKNPGRYKLPTRQCTEFVRGCLSQCGLNAGPTRGPLPDHFFNSLKGR